ncbi:hypothetical protein [Staphylococcus epidermidis]|uniref:hypothetical protein n=2 Tax=Bacteria TaxID=2 RepID=UPI0011A607CA|nr:hypothetical protein [Staphylococcus epidermidis]MBM0811420.1 hypothetical protein [Staphylococcus epidermidis]MCG1718863.1 hypothetical protein [Staphylococcus epidermidis]MCG2103360.1 hypothetical protein [Staphylococcus epidermidis]MCG2213998.1 hypothetical protein [Staphylococcus epidermidis]
MKKVFSIILKIIFIGFALFCSLISFLLYFIGEEDMRGHVIRDNSHLVGGFIALIFAFIIFPLGINMIMNTGKTRQKFKYLISKMNGEEYVPDYPDKEALNFDELSTLGKADSLVIRAYMKPMSIIMSSLLIYIFLILPMINLFKSGLELSYIISQTAVFLIFGAPIIIIIIILNIRFYPWVKLWAINLDKLDAIFPTSEGLIKTIVSNTKTIKDKYDQTPMDQYLNVTWVRNSGLKFYSYERDDSKKLERESEFVKQSLLFTQIRHAICLLLWFSSFILGWFVLPKIVNKIKKGNNIKVIKYFYPNKSMKDI